MAKQERGNIPNFPESGVIFESESGKPRDPKIRRVPLSWQHPVDSEGNFIPLHPIEMPKFLDFPEDEMGIQAYNGSRRAIPITPAFPNTPHGRFDLVDYCVSTQSPNNPQRFRAQWAWQLFDYNLQVVDLIGKRILLHGNN